MVKEWRVTRSKRILKAKKGPKDAISELTFACLNSKTYYGRWSGGRLADKLRSSCTVGPQTLQSSSGQWTPFLLSLLTWFSVLCLSATVRFFPFSGSDRGSDIEEEGMDDKGRNWEANDQTWRKQDLYSATEDTRLDWQLGETTERSYAWRSEH